MAQYQNLCLQRGPRSEESDQCAPNQSAEPDHQPEGSSDSLSLAKRVRFPIGTAIQNVPSLIRRYAGALEAPPICNSFTMPSVGILCWSTASASWPLMSSYPPYGGSGWHGAPPAGAPFNSRNGARYRCLLRLKEGPGTETGASRMTGSTQPNAEVCFHASAKTRPPGQKLHQRVRRHCHLRQHDGTLPLLSRDPPRRER